MIFAYASRGVVYAASVIVLASPPAAGALFAFPSVDALLSALVAGALALVFVVVAGAPQFANKPSSTTIMNNRMDNFIE
jgi:hypothetical protein